MELCKDYSDCFMQPLSGKAVFIFTEEEEEEEKGEEEEEEREEGEEKEGKINNSACFLSVNTEMHFNTWTTWEVLLGKETLE